MCDLLDSNRVEMGSLLFGQVPSVVELLIDQHVGSKELFSSANPLLEVFILFVTTMIIFVLVLAAILITVDILEHI